MAHAAVRHAVGRQRYVPLLARPDIELLLLAPDRWYEDGRWLQADPPQHGVEPLLAPIRLHRAGRAGWYLHYYPNLREVLTNFQPDVIHLWEEPWAVTAVHAVRLRDRIVPSAAVVLEVDQNIDKSLPPPFETFRRYTLRRTDHLLARHPDALAVTRAHGYVGPSSQVEYGCDFTLFHPNGRDAARAKLGVKGFTIGYAGRLVRDKGIEDALHALALCRHPVQFLILGDGDDRAHLELLANALGLQHRVRLLPLTHPAGVAEFMRALDCLVLLTRTTLLTREQFGRVIMEAQACGVPVIGSTSGSIPDVVGPGGWIVPERDPAAVAACLDRLVENPSMVAEVAAAAGEHARRRFTYEAVAEALSAAFHAAATARASRKSQAA